MFFPVKRRTRPSSLGSLFDDNPSGQAFGRMRQIHMGRANTFEALVVSLAVDEFLLPKGAVD